MLTLIRPYKATYEKKSSGGTFSPNWYIDNVSVWRIRNSAGQVVTNAWLCDDAVAANGQKVYLTFDHEHKGSFGAITNADGLEKLIAIYGITQYGIGNENSGFPLDSSLRG